MAEPSKKTWMKAVGGHRRRMEEGEESRGRKGTREKGVSQWSNVPSHNRKALAKICWECYCCLLFQACFAVERDVCIIHFAFTLHTFAKAILDNWLE